MENVWRADTDQYTHFYKKQEEKATRIHGAVHRLALSSALWKHHTGVSLQGEPFVWSLLVVFSPFS